MPDEVKNTASQSPAPTVDIDLNQVVELLLDGEAVKNLEGWVTDNAVSLGVPKVLVKPALAAVSKLGRSLAKRALHHSREKLVATLEAWSRETGPRGRSVNWAVKTLTKFLKGDSDGLAEALEQMAGQLDEIQEALDKVLPPLPLKVWDEKFEPGPLGSELMTRFRPIGREDEIALLKKWLFEEEHQDKPILILAASGGMGKTHLALEACRLMDEKSCPAHFLNRGRAGFDRWDTLDDEPRLCVIDYADSHPNREGLVSHVVGSGKPVKLLLLERDGQADQLLQKISNMSLDTGQLHRVFGGRVTPLAPLTDEHLAELFRMWSEGRDLEQGAEVAFKGNALVAALAGWLVCRGNLDPEADSLEARQVLGRHVSYIRERITTETPGQKEQVCNLLAVAALVRGIHDHDIDWLLESASDLNLPLNKPHLLERLKQAQAGMFHNLDQARELRAAEKDTNDRGQLLLEVQPDRVASVLLAEFLMSTPGLLEHVVSACLTRWPIEVAEALLLAVRDLDGEEEQTVLATIAQATEDLFNQETDTGDNIIALAMLDAVGLDDWRQEPDLARARLEEWVEIRTLKPKAVENLCRLAQKLLSDDQWPDMVRQAASLPGFRSDQVGGFIYFIWQDLESQSLARELIDKAWRPEDDASARAVLHFALWPEREEGLQYLTLRASEADGAEGKAARKHLAIALANAHISAWKANLDLADHLLDELRDLAGQHPVEPELRQSLASTLAIAYHYARETDPGLAVQLLDELRVLSRKHPGEQELRLERAKTLVNAHLDAGETEPGLAVQLLDELRVLSRKHPGEQELRLRLAQALFNAHLDARETEPGLAVQLLDELRQLSRKHPGEQELRLRLAQALANSVMVSLPGQAQPGEARREKRLTELAGLCEGDNDQALWNPLGLALVAILVLWHQAPLKPAAQMTLRLLTARPGLKVEWAGEAMPFWRLLAGAAAEKRINLPDRVAQKIEALTDDHRQFSELGEQAKQAIEAEDQTTALAALEQIKPFLHTQMPELQLAFMDNMVTLPRQVKGPEAAAEVQRERDELARELAKPPW